MQNFHLRVYWEGEYFWFSCEADDPEHALEQCVNAYPGCDVLNVTAPPLGKLRKVPTA